MRFLRASLTPILLLLAAAGAGGGVAGRPNLRVTAVSAAAHTVRAGATVQVTDTTANGGRAPAAASRTQYRLVPTGRHPHGRRAALGSRRVPALARRATSTGTRRVRVPRDLTPRRYRLLACADAGHALRESRERDNCRAAPGAIDVIANDAPHFAGLESAVTCLAGPAGGGRSSAYTLGWTAASDDGTPAARIVYDVYTATSSGKEDYSAPTYTSDPGATSFRTPPLASDTTYYFVVRARDTEGRRDRNRVERAGENICD